MGNKKNYQQEVLEWQWQQDRLRKKYMDTPAGFQSTEDIDVAKRLWKAEVKNFREHRKAELLSGHYPYEEFFTGRIEHLNRIRQILQEGKGPVVLYGIGGIGKSAIARQYIRQHIDDYEKVLYLSFHKSVQNMLVNDFELKISNLQYSEERYKGRRQYFLQKYEVLKDILKQKKVLIVVDDCNISYDRDLKKLFEMPCDMIVTTRINPEIWESHGCLFHAVEVKGLSGKKEWMDFVRGYQKREYSSEELQELKTYCDEIQGHTLLMQLKIRNPEECFHGYDEFQQNLFQRFHLKKEEKKILMYLSIMPVQGIPTKLFYIFANVSDTLISHLTECMLVNRQWNENWQDDMLSLHPVIAEAARKVFRPSCHNCSLFINNLSNYLSGKTNGMKSWTRTYEENHRLEPYVFAILQTFKTPEPWLVFQLEEIVTFLWIQCYFKEATQYALRLYHSVEEYYGENHLRTGFMAYRLSAVYYNSLDFEQSLFWGRKGYQILKKCRPLEEKYELYYPQTMERMAKLYRYNGQIREALEILECAIQEVELIRKRGGFEDMYFYCLLLKCKILLQMGNLDEAETIYLQEIMDKGPDEICEGFRANEFRSFYVDLLVARGKLQQAYQEAASIVECAQLYRGEHFKDTLSSMEQLADICISMGKNHEAYRLYKKIMEQLTEYYPYQEEWRNRILDKLLHAL